MSRQDFKTQTLSNLWITLDFKNLDKQREGVRVNS